jgi:hypothetical protein
LKVALTDNNKRNGVVNDDELFKVAVKPAASADSVGYAYVKIAVDAESKLDYEALYNDHYDNTAHEVLFDVTLTLTDLDGSSITATTKIRVDDENERPTAEDGDFTIEENSDAGTVVGQVVADDPDDFNADFGTLYYSFMTETTQVVIDQATGVIRVAEGADLDFETTLPDHKITLLVEVTDRGTEPQIATVVVTLTDVNEPPEMMLRSMEATEPITLTRLMTHRGPALAAFLAACREKIPSSRLRIPVASITRPTTTILTTPPATSSSLTSMVAAPKPPIPIRPAAPIRTKTAATMLRIPRILIIFWL